MNKILVIAAHPDDEILGCGGTILNHTSKGDIVEVLILATGLNSRKNNDNEISELRSDARKANNVLGVSKVNFLDFPDNKMDSVPLLNIVQKIEEHISTFKPNIIYTHSPNDLNIDHTLTSKAVITATRPSPKQFVKEVLLFEISSSSEWSFYDDNYSFSPNIFVDITQTINKKIEALSCYKSEIHEWPNARSLDSVRSLAQFRGATSGVAAAEAFRAARILR